MAPEDFHPVLQGFIGTLFTWAMTAAGASLVFFTAKVNQTIMDLFFGFAAGVMIAASCFGLIGPSVAIAEEQPWSKNISWLPAVVGFLLGAGFLKLVSHFFAHYHHHSGTELENVEITKGTSEKIKQLEEQKQYLTDTSSIDNSKEQGGEQMNIEDRSSHSSDTEEQAAGSPITGPRTKRKKLFAKLNRMLWGDGSTHPTWHKTLLLVFAITLHNFPEGLAVGVAFGAVGAAENKHRAFSNAVALAIGIGIQDFPEGLGVSMPLRRAGMSRMRSFLHGQFSGLVEPIGGVIGAAAVLIVQPILPFALSFAAGAMIFVVVEELIPESQRGGNKNIATLGTMLGFTLMMALDIALG